jgi:c-di-GMP-binding flagellar brake protein YcgR
VTSLSTKNKKRIRDAIEFLHINQRPITVQIEGEETLFASKIVKVEHGKAISNRINERLVIDWLSPQKGKDLIQSRNPIRIRFSLGKSECEFTSYYVTESTESQYLGHMITYPEALVVVDRRRNRRNAIGSEQSPLFVHAKLTIMRGGPQEESYELRVFDISEKGVGLLIGRELSGLQERIGIGDRLELELYAPWTMVRMNGTVRHKSPMRGGEYSGHQLLGIELDEKLEHYA